MFDDNGELIEELVVDGERVGDPESTFRIVTLDFLARPRFNDEGDFIGAGDGYPFPNTNDDPTVGEVNDPESLERINLVALEEEGVTTGAASFADDGTEQDALAEFLAANFADSDNAFDDEDAGRVDDQRIQNLGFRADTIFPIEGTVVVTNELNFGPGSFRNAVQIASENPEVDEIVFEANVDLVVLQSPVEYTGTQDLEIKGNSAMIRAADTLEGPGVFISSAAADLALSRLTIDGDFEDGESPANGIFVPIPSDTDGKVTVELDRVKILNSGLHGLHIADQLNDSPADIKLILRRSSVINNGIGLLDFDGVRVDEGEKAI